MKRIDRPLAIIGYTFFIFASLSLSMPKEYLYILLAFIVFLDIIHLHTIKRYSRYLLLIIITSFAAVIYTQIYTDIYQKNINKISNNLAQYTGYVYSINNADSTNYTIMLIDEELKETFAVSTYYKGKLDIGDIVEIKGEFTPFKRDKYLYSNYAKDIKGFVKIKSVSILENTKVKTLRYNAMMFKNKLINNIFELYPSDIVPIVSGIGYGDKHTLSNEIKSLFLSAGISHTLVVSGFHISIIVFTLSKIVGIIPINKKIKNLIISIFIIMYIYMIGFTPSIIRAGMMTVIMLLLSSFKKECDSITTLALIGLVCVLQNPYLSRDIGAMLSYSASIGLILSCIWMENKHWNDIIKLLFSSTMAIICMMPVLALAGMNITLLSPVYNLLFMPLVSAICVLSVITPILKIIPVLDLFTSVLVFVNKSIIETFISILKFIDKHCNFALINLGHPMFMAIILTAIVAIFTSIFLFKTVRTKKIFVLIILICSVICYNFMNYNIVNVTAFDSGKGVSFQISARGKEYLILSETIGLKEATKRLKYVNASKYDNIYYCKDKFNKYSYLSEISKKETDVKESTTYYEDMFILKSEIEDNAKKFVISVGKCDIAFGHGEVVVGSNTEYYFLGNDKAKRIYAHNMYFFDNIPEWIKTDNVYQLTSDCKIKINIKTGKHKIVKDVFNFGY